MPVPPPIRPNQNSKRPQNKFGFSISWMYLFIILFLGGMFFLNDSSMSKEVDYTTFEKYLYSNGYSKVIIYSDKNEAEGILTDSMARKIFNQEQTKPGNKIEAKVVSNISSSDKLSDRIEKGQLDGHISKSMTIEYKKSSAFTSILFTFGPILLLVGLWFLLMRRMSGAAGGGGGNSVFNVGKSKAKIFDKDNDNKVTFKDVAGLEEAKTEVEEIVEFLKNPARYTNLGGKIPKGALLVGPPGTGKTLLAKAVAGEANVPFFSMSGSDFVEMFVGVGASRVRDLFRQAKEKAPCIIFIDEIDAVGRARGRNVNMGGNDERENTLNQLLTEMDGFGSNSGVICLAATNRVDILDKALLRAGRFDRQIYVDLPDVNDRVAIFKVHLRDIKYDENLDIDLLARQTAGFSGADIANVCNEAALIAARHDKDIVTFEDFNAAVDRIIGGLEKKNKITTSEEKRGIAVHEAGHATVSWHLRYGDPLIKVTIVPRGKALGAAWYVPEERQLVPAQALLDQICSLLGGRAAEDIEIGQVATGALNDLERATKIAYSYVALYGMSAKIPNISYYDSSGQEYGFTKPYSEERARVIDDEVSRIIDEQYNRAKEILRNYQEGLKKLADELFTREVIFTADVEAIFGPRQWTSRSDEIMAINKEAKEAEASHENSAEAGQSEETKATEVSDNTDNSGESDKKDTQTPPPYKGV